jgi:hypothetical protein
MARLTPMKAIRAKCLDCMNGSFADVRNCPIEKCALYEYRMGHRQKEYNYTTESTDVENCAPICAENGEDGNEEESND